MRIFDFFNRKRFKIIKFMAKGSNLHLLVEIDKKGKPFLRSLRPNFWS